MVASFSTASLRARAASPPSLSTARARLTGSSLPPTRSRGKKRPRATVRTASSSPRRTSTSCTTTTSSSPSTLSSRSRCSSSFRSRPSAATIAAGSARRAAPTGTSPRAPAGLRFVGNVEGRDVYGGDVDVIVTDGFTGNVILKVSESLAHLVEEALKQEITRSLQASMGFLLSKDAFRSFKKRLDYSEYGGAPLLGVNGACFIGHGRSNAKAVRNAIRAAVLAVVET